MRDQINKDQPLSTMMSPRETKGRRSELQQGKRSEDKTGETRGKPTVEKTGMPPGRTWGWFLVLLFVNYVLVRLFMPSPEQPTTVPYTFFKSQVASGNVGAIYSEGVTITGRFITPVLYPTPDDKNSSAPAQKPNEETPTGNRSTPTTPPAKTTHFTTILPAFVDQG